MRTTTGQENMKEEEQEDENKRLHKDKITFRKEESTTREEEIGKRNKR